MTLAERLRSELKAAILERNELRRSALRMMIAAVDRVEKDARRPLSDEEVVGVLAREAKQRRESIEAFVAAERGDLAERERAELEILEEFLPRRLSDDELLELVGQGIAETGARSARDLGRVMGWLAPRTRGRAEGRVVSGLVARELARLDLAQHEHPESTSERAAHDPD